MTQNQYQAQQLATLLEALQNKQASGILYLNAEISPERQRRSRVLVWRDGRIVYGGINVPDAPRFVKMLEKKLNREWVDSAVAFAMRQAETQTSIRALLERLVEMQLFTWEQIESVVHTSVVLTLEQMLPHPGQLKFDSNATINICRGLELSKLMLDVAHRQDRWFSLRPMIPSIEAVPVVEANALESITDPAVHKHLHEWVDGQRSLADIAQALDKDPLSVAQSYMHWTQAGWVTISGSTPTAKISLPTVLAVDDSALMQEMIKRALTGYCQVLVASNAVDALNLIYHEKISLLLLDVSMPDMDGLELCRTIRNMSQFRDLPIIMVTARDGFFDKVKGKLAGSTEYLTKPFDAEKLRQLVNQYVNVGIASDTESTSTEFGLSTST